MNANEEKFVKAYQAAIESLAAGRPFSAWLCLSGLVRTIRRSDWLTLKEVTTKPEFGDTWREIVRQIAERCRILVPEVTRHIHADDSVACAVLIRSESSRDPATFSETTHNWTDTFMDYLYPMFINLEAERLDRWLQVVRINPSLAVVAERLELRQKQVSEGVTTMKRYQLFMDAVRSSHKYAIDGKFESARSAFTLARSYGFMEFEDSIPGFWEQLIVRMSRAKGAVHPWLIHEELALASLSYPEFANRWQDLEDVINTMYA